MAAIAFVNPKGGSGKTTLALILALEYSRRGARVAVIDADPNAIIAGWSEKREGQGRALPFHIAACPSEKTIARVIEDMSSEYDFVLIDLEGTSNQLVSRAMSRSHLVLIPFNPSPIDASLASKAVELVNEEAFALKRHIEFRLVWSRDAAAVKSRSRKRISEAIRGAELALLNTSLVERAAYRDIFDFASTLEELDPSTTSGLTQAQANAASVANEVVEVLRTMAIKETA